ncbi:MAG TPA: hypothetical protein VGG26_05035 [Terracidiphilus sp.]|jgi:hypothetical protein
MNYGLSDRVRARAKVSYVRPAASQGKRPFSIPVKDMLRDLESSGFPSNHAHQVCTALTSGKFLRENNLQIKSIDGPPSKNSTTVVVHYKFGLSEPEAHSSVPMPVEGSAELAQETPEQWAHRLTGRISGILKEELGEYGGGEAFLRWVRGYDEEDAE